MTEKETPDFKCAIEEAGRKDAKRCRVECPHCKVMRARLETKKDEK